MYVELCSCCWWLLIFILMADLSRTYLYMHTLFDLIFLTIFFHCFLSPKGTLQRLELYWLVWLGRHLSEVLIVSTLVPRLLT